MRTPRRLASGVAALLGALAMLTAPGVASGATVVNGGFEAGTFAGWTVVNQAGGFGNWYVYSGTSSPENGFLIAAPPEGTFAAVTDQGGAGSHVLYQDVALEAGFEHTLSFFLYYVNQAGVFVSPPTLDFTADANQQYRVDILRPTADPFSVAPGDVLATVFSTQPGDPVTLAPTPITFDLTSFAGTTVRIRFAEVDNLLFFNASVDAVAIRSVRLLPTSKDQCKKGGWRDFGTTFKNQGDCVSFVATNGRNQPAGGRSHATLSGKAIATAAKGAPRAAGSRVYRRSGPPR